MAKKPPPSSKADTSKKDKILGAADRLFMQKGYTHVSMDEIASATPVSKPTLYSHFADKAALFEAVITYRCNYFLQDLNDTLQTTDMEKNLQHFAEVFLAMLTSRQAIMTHRSVISEQVNFPEIGRLFYLNGPARSRILLTEYFANCQKQGRLHTDVSPELLSEMLISTLKGYMHLEVMLGLRPPPSSAAIRQRAKEVVQAFMKLTK